MKCAKRASVTALVLVCRIARVCVCVLESDNRACVCVCVRACTKFSIKSIRNRSGGGCSFRALVVPQGKKRRVVSRRHKIKGRAPNRRSNQVRRRLNDSSARETTNNTRRDPLPSSWGSVYIDSSSSTKLLDPGPAWLVWYCVFARALLKTSPRYFSNFSAFRTLLQRAGPVLSFGSGTYRGCYCNRVERC